MARLVVIASSVVLMAVCDRGEAPTSRPEPAKAPVLVEPAPAEPGPPEPPDEAWFMLEDAVVRLDAEGYTSIRGTSGIAVRDLFLDGEGRGYLVTAAGIRTILGDDLEMVVEFDEDDAVADRAAVGPDAYLGLSLGLHWKSGDESLSHWRAGSWTTKPWDDWTPGEPGDAMDIGFDPTGTAWVLGDDTNVDDRLWYWDRSGWIAAELGEASGEYEQWCFFSMHASAQALYATGPDYVMRIRGPNRVDRLDLVLPPFPSLNDGPTTRLFDKISVNSDGDVALASTRDFVRFEGDAQVAKIVTLEGYEYPTGFGFDASDRMWVASGATIRVVQPDGEVIEIPSGSVPELLPGVRDLVVLGKGPELPDPAPIRRSSVTGSVHSASVRLAHTKILVCQEPTYSPCRHSRTWASTTDATGSFSIADLPLGKYLLVIEYDEDWTEVGTFEVHEGENQPKRLEFKP